MRISDWSSDVCSSDLLLRLPFELTVSQSFGFVERQAALGRMNLTLRRMRSAEDEAVSLRGELANAKDEVAAGRSGFGEHHMTSGVRVAASAAVAAGLAGGPATPAGPGLPPGPDEGAVTTPPRPP